MVHQLTEEDGEHLISHEMKISHLAGDVGLRSQPVLEIELKSQIKALPKMEMICNNKINSGEVKSTNQNLGLQLMELGLS